MTFGSALTQRIENKILFSDRILHIWYRLQYNATIVFNVCLMHVLKLIPRRI